MISLTRSIVLTFKQREKERKKHNRRSSIQALESLCAMERMTGINLIVTETLSLHPSRDTHLVSSHARICTVSPCPKFSTLTCLTHSGCSNYCHTHNLADRQTPILHTSHSNTPSGSDRNIANTLGKWKSQSPFHTSHTQPPHHFLPLLHYFWRGQS